MCFTKSFSWKTLVWYCIEYDLANIVLIVLFASPTNFKFELQTVDFELNESINGSYKSCMRIKLPEVGYTVTNICYSDETYRMILSLTV